MTKNTTTPNGNRALDNRALGNRAFMGLIPLGALLTGLICLAVADNGTEPNNDLAQQNLSVEVSAADKGSLELAEAYVAHQDLNGDSSKFERLELDQLSSPFTKKTVLKLNKIVGRSLAAVQEFDRIRRTPDAGSTRISDYRTLSATANAARSDMSAASVQLRNSGERYNEAIFAAMVRFVDDVDDEIRAEVEQVSAVHTPPAFN